jgi:hypothetical protein
MHVKLLLGKQGSYLWETGRQGMEVDESTNGPDFLLRTDGHPRAKKRFVCAS